MGRHAALALASLLPNKSSRLAHACPLHQSLERVADSVLRDSAEQSSWSDPAPLRLNWTGLHFALASRIPDKFTVALQCASKALNSVESSGEPFQWLRFDDMSNVGSYSFGDNADAASSLSGLMHLACFYGCSRAVRALSESARHYYRSFKGGLFAGSEELEAGYPLGLPSCALSLFFEPLNVNCTPLDVCVRVGHTECAKECLDAFEIFTKSENSPWKSYLNLSWPMVLSIVISGIGGDAHCCYVLSALQERMPLSDLWRALQSPVKASPLMLRRANGAAVGGGGESVLHVLVRRNWLQSVTAALLVFSSCVEASQRETIPSKLFDGCGVSLLQASIASGHGKMTKLLAPYFRPELEAVVKITLAARKMLIRRFIKKSRRLFALRMMNNGGAPYHK